MTRVRQAVDPLVEFLHEEAASGIAVLAGTVAALIWANAWAGGYEAFWEIELGPLDLHHWVNDGLMALFFFVVGLEIKRELVPGELRDRRAAALPRSPRSAGWSLPARSSSRSTPGGEAPTGWAIPMATDIAFAVGVLALLGDRVPRRREAVPARARDRRRHRRDPRHRDLLRGRAVGRLARRRGRARGS